MVELKRGGNEANNLSTQTKPANLATLPQIDRKVGGKSPPHKRPGLNFWPPHPSKQSQLSKPIKELFFPYHVPDKSLCAVKALQVHEKCMHSFFENWRIYVSLPYSSSGSRNMKQFLAVPLLGDYKHASRMLVLTQIHSKYI